jgi:hypothetical protein
MTLRRLQKFKEPRLKFAYGQVLEDPRDGLSVFGPFDKGKINNFSVGIIGTSTGIRRCKEWLLKIRRPIYHTKSDIANPFFPGFEEVFNVGINLNVIPTVEIDEGALNIFYRYKDNHVRVSEIVDIYREGLQSFINQNEQKPQIWFVIIPDQIYLLCRPKSAVYTKDAITVGIPDEYTRHVPGMFENENTRRWRAAYNYENHFHNQLKIKLLKDKILTQIVKESTLAYEEYPNYTDKKKLKLRESDVAKAWNLSTTLYYKAGGLPWKLNDIRKGVCYIGLTFKKDDTNFDSRFACCAAQMFLDSGDGMVFRGRIGPYYNSESDEFHLTKEDAKELLSKAIESFKKINNTSPKEIFIHGKTYFDETEWSGFSEAVDVGIQLTGIRIRNEKIFKLFRANGDYPILRGSAYIRNDRTAFLWTKGFIPRIQSVLGLETPNPLYIQIVKGEADINVVCQDILALTKLNYNSCRFCDGQPVTLKFADLIGDILTAGPNNDLEVLPFMYYI